MTAGPALVFADDSLLVFNKPAGLLSVPGRGPDKQDCLSARVQAEFGDALIVHRLDMATSGLMLMARGADVQRTLSTAFETRQVHKRYVAVVQGRPAPTDATGKTDEGWSVIDAPIRVDWPHRPLRIIDAAGQPSVTRWRVAADAVPAGTDASTQPTRLDLEPVTGRSHQLRVHLRHIGHPILGDMLYAPPEVQALAPRLLLHASVLQFSHPASGAALRFESPAPF